MNATVQHREVGRGVVCPVFVHVVDNFIFPQWATKDGLTNHYMLIVVPISEAAGPELHANIPMLINNFPAAPVVVALPLAGRFVGAVLVLVADLARLGAEPAVAETNLIRAGIELRAARNAKPLDFRHFMMISNYVGFWFSRSRPQGAGQA